VQYGRSMERVIREIDGATKRRASEVNDEKKKK
jgi:hypothetical protein